MHNHGHTTIGVRIASATAIIGGLCIALATCAPAHGMPPRIAVDGANVVYRTNRLFYGVNTLFWIDDDASRRDGSYERSLRALGVKLLRYPGGTVADNFHWRTTRLDSTGRFPYEDGADKLEFAEFMELCRALGAEPMLVVNTASWYRAGKVAEGAAEAADWVRACREQGYRVTYWEIGNETYHHVLMGAREYAQVFTTYARAMKAVDPTIRVGAVGHWDWEDVGAADRLDPARAAEVRAAEAGVDGREATEAHKALVERHVEADRRRGGPQWWPTLADLAKDDIDFAVVHWYFGPAKLPVLTDTISRLKTALADRLGRPIPVALTEWNLAANARMSGFDHDLAIAEAAARFQDAGVEMAEYWPARMRAGQATLMSWKNNSLTDTGRLFALLSRHTLEHRVATTGTVRGVHAFATASPARDRMELWLVNSGKQDRHDVALVLEQLSCRSLTATVRTADHPRGVEAAVRPASTTGTFTLTLPARSFTLVSGT